MAGIVSMKDIRKVGSIGGITIVYYFCTTAVAITIGLFVANLFKGSFPVLATSSLSYEAPESKGAMDVLVNIFPSNFLVPITDANMLQVIVMAILIGFSVILLGEKAAKAIDGINLLNDIFMKCMEMILKLSPVGVFCLLTPVVAANGSAVIGSLAKVLLAFSQMLTIVLTATLASIGTAGVPGAGMVMLAMVLTSVGLPVDGIALVAGVDRIFDMGRTTLNITGDASCTIIVSTILNRRDEKKHA